MVVAPVVTLWSCDLTLLAMDERRPTLKAVVLGQGRDVTLKWENQRGISGQVSPATGPLAEVGPSSPPMLLTASQGDPSHSPVFPWTCSFRVHPASTLHRRMFPRAKACHLVPFLFTLHLFHCLETAFMWLVCSRVGR